MASVLYLALLLSLSCVLWSGADAVCPSSCPSGWSKYGNRCFLFQNTKTDWATAERNYLGYGGNLASVHSTSEHSFLKKLIRFELGSYQGTWVGGHDAEKEGVWLWSDGSKFSYSQWGKGQPDNGSQREHCMDFNNQGDMNDAPCSTKYFSICARKL